MKDAFSTKLLQEIKFMHRIVQLRDDTVMKATFALPVSCSVTLCNAITHFPYCFRFHKCKMKEIMLIHRCKFMNEDSTKYYCVVIQIAAYQFG